jgi:hypothetical protein
MANRTLQAEKQINHASGAYGTIFTASWSKIKTKEDENGN